jgi:transcription factor C subunit 7
MPKPHPLNPTGINSDPPLAPHGVEQAHELANYLATIDDDQRPQFILSSPFYRCVETGKPIAEKFNLPIVLERGVGEYYKHGRRVIPEPANYDSLQKFFPTVLSNEKEWNRDTTVGVIPSLEGESPEEIFDRCDTFWNKFFPVFEDKYPDVENILIITHAATKIALGMALLKKKSVYDYVDDAKKTILRAGAASLSKYVREEDKDWKLVMNGNTEFLAKGEEMNWNFRSGFEAGSDEDVKHQHELAEKAIGRESTTGSNGDDVDGSEHRGDSSTKDEDFEEFYVTVDIPNIGKNFEESSESGTKVHYINPSAQFQITELSNKSPLIKLSNSSTVTTQNDINNINVIDGKIYQTSWNKLVGTDLIFDEYGELIGKVNEHLTVDENVKFEAKEDEEDEDNEDSKGDSQTTFLKKALKVAGAKQAL